MASEKLGSNAKALLGGIDALDAGRPVRLLARLSRPLSAEEQDAIAAWQGRIQTQAGDIVTMSLPLRHIAELAELAAVTYIELAEPLFPER